MLIEGWRRRERGTDVVVGWVESHGRPHTEAQLRDLEVIPPAEIEYRGQTFREMDVDAVLARRPELVLVDELAHTNVPGSRHHKRWEDVDQLLDAGCNVISTINLQHLESLNDVVEQITGITQRETVPDREVRAADQIELVDMAPEALRRRLAHGNVYPAERIDAALGNYFRTGNLTALRELALLWVADRVDDELNDYRERHGIAVQWETKERVVVSLTGAPGSAVLIRRAARMAMRTKAELVGVHVRSDDVLAGSGSEGLARNRELLDELGGRFVEIVGADVGPALVAAARAENATQLVLGSTNRSRVAELFRGSVVNSVVRHAGGALDVHVIATDAAHDLEPGEPDQRRQRRQHATPARGRALLSPLPVRRRIAAVLVVVVAFPLATVAMTAARAHVDLSTALSIYLILVIAVATVGGVWPAALAALAAFLLSNYYFAPPIHTFTIYDARDVLSLVMFVVAAGAVSVLVDLSARRSAAAVRAKADAHMLARMAGRVVSPQEDPLPDLLDDLLVTFRLESAAVLRGGSDGERARTAGWHTVVAAGTDPPDDPDAATVVLPLTGADVLALRGPGLTADDRDILSGFAAQMAAAIERDQLRVEASEAETLARGNELRSALLAAVSHDLRTPLASIKTAASSLLSEQLEFGPEETAVLLRTIDEESDRLSTVVDNLLDMSRLQAGTVDVTDRAVDVAEVIDAALDALGPRAAGVDVDVPADLPSVGTDPGLLERAVANLVDNALVHADGNGLRVEAGAVAGRVDLRVVDHGPGIGRDDRERVFRPFQRLGDTDNGQGVGLGLAVARGFVEAVGGDLDIEDTPGGGTTMVIRLPVTVPPP